MSRKVSGTSHLPGLTISWEASQCPAEPDVGIMGPTYEDLQAWAQGSGEELDLELIGISAKVTCPALQTLGIHFHAGKQCPHCHGADTVPGYVSLEDWLQEQIAESCASDPDDSPDDY